LGVVESVEEIGDGMGIRLHLLLKGMWPEQR
jgi:hypothetical protein